MCHICKTLDDQIRRYRRLQDRINDRQVEEATLHMVAELEARKAALHPADK
jgi:hypothetical protein